MHDPVKILPFAQAYVLHLSNVSLPLELNADLEIRSKLMQQSLEQMCKFQEEERSLPFSRKCLFCKDMISDRMQYFHHMMDIHGFNSGHPDNLLKIQWFLDACQELLDKNQCIYCKKDFPESALLRKHMRKKKHFKINGKDSSFDQFYIINYKEKDDAPDDNQDDEEGYSDWEEEENRTTMCLFDDQVFANSELALKHMEEEHKFRLTTLKQENGWDFYDCVRLINYIRRSTSYLKCFYCHFQASSLSELDIHFSESLHTSSIPESSQWNDMIYLFPTYESDPLIMHPDLMES
jgi:hypothetical protein